MVNDVKRSGRTILQRGFVENLIPDLTTARRHLVHDACSLPDRPDHAEVTHRRTLRARSALEHDHRPPASRREVRMREAEDAGANYSHVHFSIRAHRNHTAIALAGAVVSARQLLVANSRLATRSEFLTVGRPASMLARRDRYVAHRPQSAGTLWYWARASSTYYVARTDHLRSRDTRESRHRIRHIPNRARVSPRSSAGCRCAWRGRPGRRHRSTHSTARDAR